MEAVEVDGWPTWYKHVLTDAEGKPFLHATLVL
jgi:hypothetical protein